MNKINFKALLNDSKSVSLSTKENLVEYINLGEELAYYSSQENIDTNTSWEIYGRCARFHLYYCMLHYDVEYQNLLSPKGKDLWEVFNKTHDDLLKRVEKIK